MMPSTIQSQTSPNSKASAAWVRHRSAGYLTGRGLSFGVAGDLFPRQAIASGKFSINIDVALNPTIAVCDGRVDVFADDAFDHVVIGPRLAATPEPDKMFRDLAGKLKVGGHMILYLPYKYSSPDTMWEFTTESVRELFGSYGSWKLKTTHCRDGALLWIAKKVLGRRGQIVESTPTGTKRACIVRYGAIGDMIMITPLIKQLAADGYKVTMNITPYAASVLDNNPYVSNIIYQEREVIPNSDLGNYWAEWKGDYEKYINLSESIEGSLLKVEGREDFFTSHEWRGNTCNLNYYDYTMSLGGYPGKLGQRGELYFTRAEERTAKAFRDKYRDKFLIVWGLNGSSHHKVYPFFEAVMTGFLDSHLDAILVTVGDQTAKTMQFSHPQAIHAAGDWTLRQVFALLPLANLVVGPESAIINAAGCFDVPKIVFLSHSTHENLTKYFTNVYPLDPDTTQSPCYPCHQLHYSLESCPIGTVSDVDTNEVLCQAPLCTLAIPVSRVLETLEQIHTKYTIIK
jgi:ADP-heptose:LPS heptosyltransferase